MKKGWFVFTILLCLATNVLAQNLNMTGPRGICGEQGGCNNPLPPPTPSNTPLDDVATSGGVSVDPNEIIGPVGYDSVRWVSINDVLNYTILFENDPEFATANAQKVDVRFRFEDKLVLSRNKQY